MNISLGDVALFTLGTIGTLILLGPWGAIGFAVSFAATFVIMRDW